MQCTQYNIHCTNCTLHTVITVHKCNVELTPNIETKQNLFFQILPLYKLYFSQKQLSRKMKSRLSIIKCAGYTFWQLFLRRLNLQYDSFTSCYIESELRKTLRSQNSDGELLLISISVIERDKHPHIKHQINSL